MLGNQVDLAEVQTIDKKGSTEPCAHCNGEGTCKSGQKNSTCKICVTKNKPMGFLRNFSKLPSSSNGNEEFYGLVCSICRGRGCMEPKGQRLSRYTLAGLTVAIFFFSGTLIYSFKGSIDFPAILAFVSTLMGGMMGYYFGQKRKT